MDFLAIAFAVERTADLKFSKSCLLSISFPY
jgi:hypothetical protein